MYIPKGYRLLNPDEVLKDGDLGIWIGEMHRESPYIWVVAAQVANVKSSYYIYERHYRKIEKTPRGNTRR